MATSSVMPALILPSARSLEWGQHWPEAHTYGAPRLVGEEDYPIAEAQKSNALPPTQQYEGPLPS